MQYDHKLDNKIVEALLENATSFTDLRKLTKTNKRILSNHLKELERASIVKRDPFKIGRARFVYLTDSAKLEKSLGIFEGVVSKRESRKVDLEETRAMKDRKLMQLLFFIGQVGGGRITPVKEAQLGNIMLHDKAGKLVPHTSSRLEGFGMSDFSNDVNLWMSTQAGAFAYLRFSKSELQAFFKKLLTSNPPLIEAIGEYEGETRYGLTDRSLGRFILDCWILFTVVLDAIRAKWKYLGKPSPREWNWHRFFYGALGTRGFHLKLINEREKDLADFIARYPKFSVHAIKRAKRVQANESYLRDMRAAREMYEKLMAEHSGTIRKYERLVTEFLIQVYPKSLRNNP